MSGWFWMLRRFGLRRTWRYWCWWRGGMLIDYGLLFTSEERARLAEHIMPMPWEVDQ